MFEYRATERLTIEAYDVTLLAGDSLRVGCELDTEPVTLTDLVAEGKLIRVPIEEADSLEQLRTLRGTAIRFLDQSVTIWPDLDREAFLRICGIAWDRVNGPIA